MVCVGPISLACAKLPLVYGSLVRLPLPQTIIHTTGELSEHSLIPWLPGSPATISLSIRQISRGMPQGENVAGFYTREKA